MTLEVLEYSAKTRLCFTKFFMPLVGLNKITQYRSCSRAGRILGVAARHSGMNVAETLYQHQFDQFSHTHDHVPSHRCSCPSSGKCSCCPHWTLIGQGAEGFRQD